MGRTKYKTEHKAGYDSLANAIIMCAVKDYRAALKKMWKEPDDVFAQSRISEVRRFFHSQYFTLLCDANDDRLIRLLDEEFCKSKGLRREEVPLLMKL